MSLYGPRLRLPKVDIPNPASPSWNFDKEKKWIIGIAAVIVAIVLIVFLGPMLMNGIGEGIGNSLNPAVQISWSNNPLNLKASPADNSVLTITFTNTTKEMQDISFDVTSASGEIIPYCPDGPLLNVAAGDKRVVTCSIRKNPDTAIFTGSYTIDINSTLGTASTKLEVMGK